jgi:hypothetical protein
MGVIRFVNVGYWDQKTMKIGDSPTDEQMNKVTEFCQRLTAKYAWDKGCAFHPDREQLICVYFSNDYIDFQIQHSDTCGCVDIVNRLIEVRNWEMIMNNERYIHLRDKTQ